MKPSPDQNVAAMMASPHVPIASADTPTLMAIAITAYLCGVVIHEALGHGLMALLLGLHPTRVSSVDLEVSFRQAAMWKMRMVSAAGCAANLMLAGVAIWAGRRARKSSGATQYFFWLLAVINLLSPGGYLMVLTFPGIGDWGDFTRGLHPLWIWKSGLTALGLMISIMSLRWGVRHLRVFLGQEEGHRRRAWKLTLLPYLTGSTINTLAGILNPVSPWLILISAAAASFGGTSWLIWIGAESARRKPHTGLTALTISRHQGWLAMGAAALAVYFFVLGPGWPR